MMNLYIYLPVIFGLIVTLFGIFKQYASLATIGIIIGSLPYLYFFLVMLGFSDDREKADNIGASLIISYPISILLLFFIFYYTFN